MKPKLSFKITVMLISVIITKTVNAQGMLIEVPLKRQIEKSSLVIEGKVIDKESVWNEEHNNIYTINTVEVYKVFKGSPESVVEIVTYGGKVGDIEQVVMPSLKLDINDIGVFALFSNGKENTLKKTSIKKFSVYSSLQGFYKYYIAKDVVKNPFNKKQGISNSFYNEIMDYTKSKYTEMSVFNIEDKVSRSKQAKILLPPVNITFSPTTITAGTKTVLTISGAGFGPDKGKVGFRDADSGGVVSPSDNTAAYIDALDSQVLSWTDTQITVEVPSKAGTGDIRITHDDTTEGFSGSTLTISYSLINTSDGFGTQHFSANGNGDLTWQMNTGFDANTAAKESFLRAFESWRCETKVNWLIGSNTSVNSSLIDGVNVISFDNAANPLPDGVLGQCSYVIGSCSPRTVRDLVGELDIVFDDDINDPATPANESWYFGSDPNGIAFEQWDFESVALHELGHGHQLAHVINTNDVMHYAISNSEVQRVLAADDKAGAGVIQNFSTTTALCGTTLMTDYAGTCNLSIEEQELKQAIAIYPNPARSEVFIKNESFLNLDKAVLYDISGRLISEYDLSHNVRTKPISLTGVSKGVYFISIHSERAFITKKIILE